MKSTIKDKKLSDIANTLLSNIYRIDDIGLYHGKAGIILFLYEYARYTGEHLYYELADELLEELCNNIYTNSDMNMQYGLCGIGWFIEYLLVNNFIEGDSNEILYNIDKKISEIDYKSLTDISIDNGLAGIYNYIHIRINSNFNLTGKCIFNRDHLNGLESILQKPGILSIPAMLRHITKRNPMIINTLKDDFGLENGIAGYGLRLI